MGDLLALIQGLRDGGAGEIVLYDGHFQGRNVDVTQLPAQVGVIDGRTARLTGTGATEVWGDYWTVKLQTRASENLSPHSDIGHGE